jgi:rSAM/selenodomain-associated transferase 1
MNARTVVVMGKLPEPGRVKTRMCPPLSPEQAASLYEAFLLDVFHLVESASSGARRVFHCASDDLEAARVLAPSEWDVVLQRGGTLGERIEEARVVGDAERVVILGSDAPTMPAVRIGEAFDRLADHRAVFGPTEDGGYDLVGFAGAAPELLDGIPWSTGRVMAETRAAAVRHDIAIATLTVGYDVDHAHDLLRTLEDARRLRRSHTTAAIERVLATLPDPD